jgi:hypothetical protein
VRRRETGPLFDDDDFERFRVCFFSTSFFLIFLSSLSFGTILNYGYTILILFYAGNAAIFDYATGGPFFGASDLIFGEPQAAVMGGFAGPSMEDAGINAGNLKRGRSSLGFSYQLPVDGKWPVRGEFQLVQLEVYCNSATISDAYSSTTTSASPSWWPF